MTTEDDVFERGEIQAKSSRSGWQGAIANYFQFDYYKTNFRTEILAGITTMAVFGIFLTAFFMIRRIKGVTRSKLLRI